eukprot:3163106-Pleurochrysis_carterae.AAC.4
MTNFIFISCVHQTLRSLQVRSQSSHQLCILHGKGLRLAATRLRSGVAGKTAQHGEQTRACMSQWAQKSRLWRFGRPLLRVGRIAAASGSLYMLGYSNGMRRCLEDRDGSVKEMMSTVRRSRQGYPRFDSALFELLSYEQLCGHDARDCACMCVYDDLCASVHQRPFAGAFQTSVGFEDPVNE